MFLSITPVYLEILFTVEFEYTVQSHSGVVCDACIHTDECRHFTHAAHTQTETPSGQGS